MPTLALVVFSGGLDSTTALAEAIRDHGATDTMAVSFNYGQKHKVELEQAKELAKEYYNIEHFVFNLPPVLFVGGSLTGAEEVADMRYDDLPSGTMSPTYVPFRNGNLLAQAAAFADSMLRTEVSYWNNVGGSDLIPNQKWEQALIYAGMHAEDAAGFAYADCTPEFLGTMAAAINIGTYGRVRLHALYQYATKAEIILRGRELCVPYHLTHSCYRGERPACGTCSTCQARLDAFKAAGLVDPLPYRGLKEGVTHDRA